jgi:ABC-type spermidine/putrescine transport system permease subunit II
MKARWGWFLVLPLILCAGLTMLTQFSFLEKSFFKELGLGNTGAFVGLDNYVAVFRSPFQFNAIVTTLQVAAAATIGCVLFAYPVAYTIARMSSRWGAVLLAAVLLASLVTAPIKVLGLIIIFAKESGLNRLLMWLGLTSEPVSLLGSRIGVIVGLMYYSLAFAVLLLYSVIRTIPYSLQEAAEIHGCSHWRGLWRVVLPLSVPGLVAVSLTIFNLSMGAFASAVLMGAGKVPTLPVLIYQMIFIETKYATASTLAMILLGMVLLVNLASVLLLARFGVLHTGDVSDRGRKPRGSMLPDALVDALRALRVRVTRVLSAIADMLGVVGIRLPVSRILTVLSLTWVYLFLFAPLLVIVAASFNGGSNRSGTVIFPPRRLSLDWYFAIPAEHLWSFGLSLLLAAVATLIACLIAIPAGLGLVRSRARGREIAGALFRLPLQIPVVIVGLSFYYAFYVVDDALGTQVNGSFAALVIAHLFVLTPYVIGSVTAVLQRFDERLEEAGQSLGAGRWRTFRRITLPVIMPGVFAGAVYAFMVSFGDVPISLFLAGPDTVTFPVAIFHSMELDFDATVLASSTLVMLFGMVLLLAVQRLIGLDTMTRSEAGARG